MIEAEQGQTRYDISEIYDDETGVLRRRQVRLNGKLHAPSNSEPSHAAYDEQGRPIFFQWHNQDLEHNASGPSGVHIDPETGFSTRERFMLDDHPRPQEAGPYIIDYDRKTGVQIGTRQPGEVYPKLPQSPTIDKPENHM